MYLFLCLLLPSSIFFCKSYHAAFVVRLDKTRTRPIVCPETAWATPAAPLARHLHDDDCREDAISNRHHDARRCMVLEARSHRRFLIWNLFKIERARDDKFDLEFFSKTATWQDATITQPSNDSSMHRVLIRADTGCHAIWHYEKNVLMMSNI